MGFWTQTFKFTLYVGTFAALVLGIVKYFYVDAYVVGHDGMAPTMLAGEKVLAWRTKNVGFGEIAVCENPAMPGALVIGRLLATQPGQVIGTERGALRIAGQTPDIEWDGLKSLVDARTGLNESYRLGTEHLGSDSHPVMLRERGELSFHDVTLDQGEAFLLGDNRSSTGQDSRTFGPVKLATCHAQVFFRVEATDRGADLGHGRFDILR